MTDRPNPPLLPPEFDPLEDEAFDRFFTEEIIPLLSAISEKTFLWMREHKRTNGRDYAQVSNLYCGIITALFGMISFTGDIVDRLMSDLAEQMRQQVNRHRKPGGE